MSIYIHKSIKCYSTIILIILNYLPTAQAMTMPTTINNTIELITTPSGHFLIPVTIGKLNTHFLVDTGSSSSVIDVEFIKIIDSQNKKLHDEVIQGVSPGELPSDMRQFSLSGITLAGVNNVSFDAVEQPIAAILNDMYTSPITGIVGQDVLAHLQLSLDLKDNTLVNLTKKSQSAAFKEQYTAIALNMSGVGLPFINVAINGKNFGLIIDSGAGELMLDKGAVAPMKITNIQYPKEMVAFNQNGAQRQIGLAENVTITLGKHQFNSSVLIDDFNALLTQANEGSNTQLVGIIGFNVLSKYDGIIDLANQTLYVKAIDDLK